MDLACENQRKKTKCKEEDDQPRSRMESLARDTTLEILSRLPITSLMQFRFVNRAWNTLSHDPLLAELHFSRTAENNPGLILHCDYPIRNQLYFVELSDHHQDNQIVRKIRTPFCDLMPEFSVVASCHGLLCLSDSFYCDPTYIYNPFTHEYQELPRSRQFDDQEVVFGFGFHPLTKEYKVIKITLYWNRYNGYPRYRRSGHHNPRTKNFGQSEVQVYSLGSTTWKSIGELPYLIERKSSEALVNGRLHWACGQRIVSFDLADERFEEVPRPGFGRVRRHGAGPSDLQLAVLGGCLSAAVCRNYHEFEIWVMKEYSVKESWVMEFNIGGYFPKLLKLELQQSEAIWRRILRGRIARVLCLLKNGNVLVEYKGGVLVSYDPESGTFTRLMLEGMPELFEAFVHVGCLNSVHTPIYTNTK